MTPNHSKKVRSLPTVWGALPSKSFSGDQMKKDALGSACVTSGLKEMSYIEGSGAQTWRKRQLWRPKLRWEDSIKVGLKEIEWGCMEWIWLGPW
jgi:hypothetical protein